MRLLKSFLAGRKAKGLIIIYLVGFIMLLLKLFAPPMEKIMGNEVATPSTLAVAREMEDFKPEQTRFNKSNDHIHASSARPEINASKQVLTTKGSNSGVSTANSYFKKWARNIVSGCSGLFTGYSNILLKLSNVHMQKTFSTAKAIGGTDIKGIMNQPDDSETCKLKKGFFQLACASDKPSFSFDKDSAHLKDWLPSLEFISLEDFQGKINNAKEKVFVEDTFTIALMRYEFANVYWVVMDLYNIYLTTRFFNKNINITNVLLIDERPKNHLDGFFQTIYHAKQLHSYPNLTVFKNLVWMYGRAHGPLLTKQESVPLVPEFKRDVLQAFGLPTVHKPNCDALNFNFIWRRNYVAHPRNPSGIVNRKIKNEDELLNATKSAFPSANIKGVQMDNLTAREQIELISTTDILIGMHGAAYGFTLFLPSGSAAIEMFPYGFGANWHMEYLVKWAGAHYKSWKNKDKKLEDTVNKYTTVPPNIVIDFVKSLIVKICPR